jgi:hypothetical protein
MEVKIMKTKMIVVTSMIVVGLCGSVWALDGIVSHWRFDQGSGNIAYDSAGTNDGTIYGATWTTGKIDGALSFDDVDDYVIIADDPSLRFTQYDSFSVSFWAKPSNGGYVFSKLNAYPQSGIFGYALRWLSDTYKFQFMTQESGIDNVFVDTSNNSVHPGIWYFGTAVYDNKNMKVYLNAELKGTNFFGLDTGSTSPDNNFAIGVRLLPSILEQHFGGIIDDVMIFDKALSDQEILEIYHTGMGDTEWTLGVPVIEVNTEYAEWDPFLSADGLSLYYSKGKTDTFYFHRLYQATRQEPFGPFTSINEISELNYSGGHIQDPWVSSDNLRLYYMRTEPGNYWRLKFSERASVNDPWPVGVNISELNVLNQMLRSPTLTADELTIFFSSFPTNPIPGGEGGDDIWMATRPDRYSPFGNITNQIGINTAASEGGPSVSPDGLTLVFDSDCNGKWQLFKATRESLTEPFGNVEHLWACDTHGGSSATPCLSSDGSAIYYRSHTATRSTDIFVSYLIEEPIEDPLEAVITHIEDAIAEKVKALEKVNAAIEQEWAAYDALEQLLESGDYGDLKKGDIVTAMQNTHSSIQHQQQSIDALQKSIEKLLYSLSALGYGPQPPGSNWPPNVTITQPEDGAVFTPSQTIEIEAEALDFDGSVVMVEFFANGSKIGEDNEAADGWITSWSDHPEGTYSLTAQVTDNEGATTTSPAVEITVFVPPPPPPPPPIPPPPLPPPPPGP